MGCRTAFRVILVLNSLKGFLIINSNFSWKRWEKRDCFSKLGNEFETGLNNYQKLLDEIQGGPTVNLNNLTVLLSRLDFLEKIKTPANQGNAD